jgi:PKD repeat protein
MADVFPVAATAYTAWDYLAPADSYLEAMGTVGTCKTLNTAAGNRIGGTLNTGSLPSTMTISQVQVQANFWRTAVYAGQFRWFVELGGVLTYSALVKPGGDSSTTIYSGALARPGGGTWTKTDLTTVKFGIECYGDGPWNGEEGSGGEGRMKNLALEVTYTSTGAPVVDFSGTPLVVFENSTVAFSDLSLNTPSTWSWDFGDTGTSTTQHPTHTYATQPAPYPNNSVTVTLTATNTYTTATDSEVKTNYVAIWKTTDPITADFTVSTTSGDFPLTVYLTDSSIGLVSGWTWAFGDTGTSTDENPTHTYSTVGTYTVVLTAANTYTTDSESKASLINVTSPVPAADFTGSPVTGTRPLSVTFTASNTLNKEITAYTWNFGDSQTAALSTLTHEYLAAGTYTVTLTLANSYGTDSEVKTNYITVSPVTATASYTANRTIGWDPMEVRFFDNSTGDVADWLWAFSTEATTTASNPKYLFTALGTNTVTLTVNAAAAVNTSSITGTVYLHGDMSYGRFLDELGRVLLEAPELLPCSAFTAFGGAARVLDFTYDRVAKFLLETGILQKTSAATAVTGSTGFYSLPTDLVELRRVEVDSRRVEPLDLQQADYWEDTWETSTATTTSVQGFFTAPATEGLLLGVVPAYAAVTNLNVQYVYVPARPSVPGDCTTIPDPWAAFPLPYVFWWIIRYGVLADLFRQEGDTYDGPRAEAAEAQWQLGLELAKLLQTERGQQ